MYYDSLVLSDQLARERQQAILREVAHIRLVKQVASARPARPRHTVQHLLAALLVVLQR